MDDPSEFEGTVEKSSDAMSAGLLEDILAAAKPKFTQCDLSRELGELHLQIFNLQQSCSLWARLSVETLKDRLDEQALKIADMKEGYVGRKKILAATMRTFSKKYFHSDAAEDLAGASELVGDCKQLVQAFKTDFDFLGEAAKFSEASFMSAYKAVHEMEDPHAVVTQCFATCIRSQDALKNAVEQLANAQALLDQSAASSSQSSAPASDKVVEEMKGLREELAQLLELKASMGAEIIDMKNKFEAEYRTRELGLRDLMGTQLVQIQQAHESSMAQKDAEIASLLSSLNDLKLKTVESDQRERAVECEASRRREAEDRVRSLLKECGELKADVADLRLQLESTGVKAASAEALVDKERRSHREALASSQQETRTALVKISSLEAELLKRPPVDVTALASRMGIITHQSQHDEDETDGSSERENVNGLSRKHLAWSDIEVLITDGVRQANSAAAESRVREMESRRALETSQADCSSLRSKLAEQSACVQTLEQDLLSSQRALEDAKALLRVDRVRPVSSAPASLLAAVKDEQQASLVDVLDVSNRSAAGTAKATPDQPVSIEVSSGGYKVGKIRGVSIAPAQLMAISEAAPADSATSSSDRLLQAVQSQRDRFMKSSQEKEQELVQLKSKLDSAQEEQMQLRSENLELYRRLRVLRAQSGKQEDVEAGGGGGVGGTGGTSSSKPARGKAGAGGSGSVGNGDAIDSKYASLQEQSLDPFRLEELDRHSVYSKLSALERGMALVMRSLLQDRWVRHALMVYLFLVHCFALAYVMRVLNPQLIEEVDIHMKQKWSAATFKLGMEGEHPDLE